MVLASLAEAPSALAKATLLGPEKPIPNPDEFTLSVTKVDKINPATNGRVSFLKELLETNILEQSELPKGVFRIERKADQGVVFARMECT